MLDTLRKTFSRLNGSTSRFGMEALRSSFSDVDEALQGVESVLGSLRSWEAPLAAEVASHLATAGGKRLRPALLFLSYGASEGEDLSEAKPYAVGSELIHTATLLHDDVIDEGTHRRGVPTANETFGNVNAILSGDYLVAHVIQNLLERGRIEPVRHLAIVMSKLVQGEILQDEYIFDPDLSEEQYLQIARLKTSSLFSYSAWCGSYLPNEDSERAGHFSSYAEHLGIAFQIVDDVLDYESEATEKTPLADLRDGKLNYPLILALERDAGLRSRMEAVFSEGTPPEDDTLHEIKQAVRETDALSRARDRAGDYTSRARACLEDLGSNRYCRALDAISSFVAQRIS